MSLSVNVDQEVDLEEYYNSNPQPKYPCNDSEKTRWWCLTPYNCLETFNYFIKMLVLPGVIAGIIILIMILTTGAIDNLILLTIISILMYTGSFFISIFTREQTLAWLNKIRENDQVKIVRIQENYETQLVNTIDTLNSIKDPKYIIGFVGDIMMMRDFTLRFDNDVKTFFKKDGGVRIILGNLEGIVRNLDPPEDPPPTKQSHPPEILNQLNQLLLSNNTRWLLCLSNNHSIDFSNHEFHESLKYIQAKEKIDVFGRNDVPNVYIKGPPAINIASATEWSNQHTWKCISKYRTKKLEPYYEKDKFNILYPHWNFENEKYVRKRLQKRAKKLLTNNDDQNWDLIFGHHPHVRQPVIKIREDLLKDDGTPVLDADGNPVQIWKLVAFSGGNFTSGVRWIRRKKHIHGRIMRCEIGPLTKYENKLAVGKVEIVDTVNKEGYDNDRDIDFKTVKFGLGEKGINRIWILVIGLVIVAIVVLLRVFGIF